MATFFLDYEGGNDSNDGTTFANRWKTFLTGATAARIAPGDTIKVMGSPAPTSLGITGVWTDGPAAATVSITSSTNATPIVITKASHGFSNGDTIDIVSHTTNTNANGMWTVANVTANTLELSGSTGNGIGGASGTMRLKNCNRVTLASALTLNIASTLNKGEGRAAWTASANVTSTLSTADFKCSDCSDSHAVAAGFTTGLASYFNTGTLNLSGYQGVSFWIKQTAGTVAVANDINLSLCTATNGVTVAHTVLIPGLVALNKWVPVYWDNLGGLNSAIVSIGFNVAVDNGAQTFLLSNIIAVKASSGNDALNLQSLIGKNTATETWWGVQSINGTRVMLDENVNAIPTDAIRGYSGTTETVTTYKRETIKTTMVASAATAVHSMTDSGTAGNLISFEGGWDRTAMTTQNLETWYDGRNGLGIGFSGVNKTYISLNKLSAVRYDNSIDVFGVGLNINNAHFNNNISEGMQIDANSWVLGTVFTCANGTIGVNNVAGNGFTATQIYCLSNSGAGFSDSAGFGNVVTSISANNNGSTGITTGTNSRITTAIASKNAGSGVSALLQNTFFDSLTANTNSIAGVAIGLGGITVRSGSASGNTSGSVTLSTGTGYFRKFTMSDATEVSGWTAFGEGKIYSEQHDGTANNFQIFCDGGLIQTETSTNRHTLSGVAWKLSPTSTNRTVSYPLFLKLAEISCTANTLVTVTAWMMRDSSSLTGSLVCRGKQIAGVDATVSASVSGTSAYELVTISFTPTEAGVVEIEAWAYGGTTLNLYVDDMNVT